MLGDIAVAVHPEDKRYQCFAGKKIRLPITDRVVPLLFDSYVDQTFGTGALKITPGHDFNDFEIGERFGLDRIVSLTPMRKSTALHLLPAAKKAIGSTATT